MINHQNVNERWLRSVYPKILNENILTGNRMLTSKTQRIVLGVHLVFECLILYSF